MKMSMIIQKTIDNLWERTFFKILPRWITPNHLTLLRLLFVPVVLYYLMIGNLTVALIFFIFAILTDSADGALARKRNLGSAIGGWLDPLADKFLIIIFLLFLYKFFFLQNLILVIVIIEIVSIISSAIVFFIFKNYKIVRADWWGKFKLVFQVAGIIILALFVFYANGYLLAISIGCLATSLILSLASIYNHLRNLAVN